MKTPPKPLAYPLETLFEMLTYQRPAWSPGEHAFIERYIDPLPGCEQDTFGNRWVSIPRADGITSRTLFSAHTDTVHPKPNVDHRQKLEIDGAGILTAAGKQQLGADNGVGCWVMLNLIAAGVPGTYVFHRAEEVGGKGSDYIATHYKAILTQFDRAIAFDRRNTNSVITHQSCERGCSTEFATALIEGLGMSHELDDGGTFTDTRNYFDIIPECTNVSAGYDREHTFDEYLDVHYAEALAHACIGLAWEALPTRRDPSVTEYLYDSHDYYDDYRWSFGHRHTGSARSRARTTPALPRSPDMHTLVYENPEEVADLLIEWGLEEDDVWEFIMERRYGIDKEDY